MQSDYITKFRSQFLKQSFSLSQIYTVAEVLMSRAALYHNVGAGSLTTLVQYRPEPALINIIVRRKGRPH